MSDKCWTLIGSGLGSAGGGDLLLFFLHLTAPHFSPQEANLQWHFLAPVIPDYSIQAQRERVCVWKCVWFSRFLFAVFNFKRKERQREREKTVPPQVIYLDQISLIDPVQSMADKHFVPRLKSLTTVQEISHVLDLRHDGITRTEEMWWCVCVYVHFSLGHLFWLKRK